LGSKTQVVRAELEYSILVQLLIITFQKKPKIRVPERSRCEAMVHVDVMGHNMTSKSNAKCTGEFCFKVEIRSEIGNMKEYRSVGARKKFN